MPDTTPIAPPPTPGADPDLRHPSLLLNRELSWLEFNRRVLHEARDERTPLLERLKFLGIFSSNLDEFYQVRVAGLRQQLAAGVIERTADGLTPAEQLTAIRGVVRDMVGEHGACLTREVLPALRAAGVTLHARWEDLPAGDRARLTGYFMDQVFPVLTPLAVDPAHPFPYISNLSLSLAVVLRGDDGEERFARVKVPKILPRFVPVGGPTEVIPLEQVIGAHLETMFPGVEILGWHLFRITRNTDLQIDHDEAEDLLELIQEEIRNRRFGEVVRIELAPAAPDSLRRLLLAEFSEERPGEAAPLSADDLHEVEGLLDAADLLGWVSTLDLPELRDPPFHPGTPTRLQPNRSLFEVLAEGDILVHHPFDGYGSSVERFLQQAAEDPDVLAIKLTLYRTGGDATIARLLTQAAERGKQVAVLVELQARFDEENNIRWAQRLEDIGVHVSYGVAGLKTHCKVLLVVRREGEQIRRYVHIGTGNYNPKTARLYTDFGLFSADPALGADLTDLFNVLTGFGAPASYRKLIVAPRGMRARFLELVRREERHALAGRPARLLAKMNSLVDPEMIAALYGASRAGVTVDLLVRGICCLRPGVPGVSERVRVVSIIGRFLEHSRAWWFQNGGDDEAYIGSADWMPRNLDRRIEAVVPIEDPVHRRAIREVLELLWSDNRQAWELSASGEWTQRRPPTPEHERASHVLLAEQASR